jgi:transcriptional regulator with XRE-family HTH domain
MDETLGQRVARLRESAGMTQKRLGELLGLSPPAVWAWENGTRKVLAGEVPRIARALGVSAADVLGTAEIELRLPKKPRPPGPRRGRPPKRHKGA